MTPEYPTHTQPMADAGILAWENKYNYDLWRPVVGIREHDTCFGPEPSSAANNLSASCDPSWAATRRTGDELAGGTPTMASEHWPCNGGTTTQMKNFTPNFPAYPSGHASFGAAAFHTVELFYAKLGKSSADVVKDLRFVSDELNGRQRDNKGTVRPRHERKFSDLHDMLIENGLSRIYLGVHWSFDAFDTTGPVAIRWRRTAWTSHRRQDSSGPIDRIADLSRTAASSRPAGSRRV